jgi:trehalose-phosphatase
MRTPDARDPRWPVASVGDALARAESFLARAPVLLVSDFDGTLAVPRPDPWAASIEPGARRALRRLAGHPDVAVALLSGRAAADLADRVRVGGARYLGDHGAQRATLARRARWLHGPVARDPVDPADVALASALADDVPRAVPEPWLVVERKLPAVCFHFRTAPDLDEARARVQAAVDAIDASRRLQRWAGPRALELRPSAATTKAQAVARLLSEVRPRAVLAMGDDRHDAGVFAALREGRSNGGPDGLSLAVASVPEWLPDVAPHADLLLAGPRQAAAFLSGLARRLSRPG